MQAFATRWDFLFASVLIGVDRSTGVFSGSEPAPGQQMVAVWTSAEIAEEALHVESWELRPILVRDLLPLLPAGVGVQVDPERTSGMTASAAYVAGIRRFAEPFPVDAAVRVTTWDEIPDGALAAVAQAADEQGVRELHALMYTVDDSPPIGCLAWVADESADPSAVGWALETALLTAAGPADLAVVTVRVLPLSSVPQEIRAAIGDRHVLRRRRRTRFWRR
ncbi:hypothetical protein IFT73_14460 [Aeromicrobium sp. CFBP 8757]|uniref:hypothetical protein n=1 Tax=Aeromicrobium sp. CFBP 8757 TaxID=2775288 RepID=UPI001781DD1D|nr:hypothetical protein [Aeromicrobium sp. CFBP 8757]MBD8608057.1 hypothetical protein [Aeromicrobium sp. CFBP 8757]